MITLFNVDNGQNCACVYTCTAGFRAQSSLGDRLHFPGACCAEVSCVTAEGPSSAAETLGVLQFLVLALEKHDLQQLVS